MDITANYSVYPDAVAAAFGGNDRLYLFWWDVDGIIMYREPPAGAVAGPSISSVSNGTTHLEGVVSGSWVEIKGVNLSGVTRTWGSNDFTNGDVLPTALNGVQVKINGLLAPVYYISPTQINVQAPASLSGTVSVVVINNGVSSNTLNVAALQSAPGLFDYTLSGKNFPSALYNGTYTIVGDPALYPQLAKAKAGDIIQLYGTGLGPSSAGNLVNSPVVFSSPVTVSIGSASVYGVLRRTGGGRPVPDQFHGAGPCGWRLSDRHSNGRQILAERRDHPDHPLKPSGAGLPACPSSRPTRTSRPARICRAQKRPTAAPPLIALLRRKAACLPRL